MMMHPYRAQQNMFACRPEMFQNCNTSEQHYSPNYQQQIQHQTTNYSNMTQQMMPNNHNFSNVPHHVIHKPQIPQTCLTPAAPQTAPNFPSQFPTNYSANKLRPPFSQYSTQTSQLEAYYRTGYQSSLHQNPNSTRFAAPANSHFQHQRLSFQTPNSFPSTHEAPSRLQKTPPPAFYSDTASQRQLKRRSNSASATSTSTASTFESECRIVERNEHSTNESNAKVCKMIHIGNFVDELPTLAMEVSQPSENMTNYRKPDNSPASEHSSSNKSSPSQDMSPHCNASKKADVQDDALMGLIKELGLEHLEDLPVLKDIDSVFVSPVT